MITVFFSYSHRDETLRDELEVHLSMLKRQEVIGAWHDRRIGAGNEFAGAISEHLERADIILLLVSPYFLASDYCYEVEMKRAMERHESGQASVIPVIIHPCDWHSAPFGKLLAVPTDGKPVSKHPNQHDAFLEVAKAVRMAAEGLGKATKATPMATSPIAPRPMPDIRSSNLRIKKNFTDADRDAFLDDAFEYIAKFFEGSLQELQTRNPGMSARFKRMHATRFTAVVYRNGTSVGECSVRLGGLIGPSITYAHDANSDNSFNEGLTIANDGHTMFLKPMGMSMRADAPGNQLSPQGAAEYLWTLLISPLQR